MPTSVENVDLGIVDGPADGDRGERLRVSDLVKGRVAGRLRGAVKVEQDTTGDDLSEATSEVAAQHLPARHPETEVRKASAELRRGVDHGTEQGRDQDDPRHAVLGEHANQPPRLPRHLLGDHHDGHALEQGPEDLPDRVHEAGGRLLTAHLRVAEGIRAPHPAEAVDGATVQPQDTLGSTGRPRRVDDVGEPIATGPARKPRLALARDFPPVGVEEHHPHPRRHRLGRLPLLGDQHPRAGIRDHECQALGRIARIQRHEGTAGLEHGEHRREGHA